MKTCRLTIAAATIVACIFTVPAMAQGPWYVTTNGVDEAGRDGLSWPASWATIGYAVGRAAAGGTIFVSNGVYTLSGQILVDKVLTIESVNGRDATVVDGNGVDRCFKMNAIGAVLRGFTVTNGYRDTADWQRDNGGGILITKDNVTIDDCLIVDNGTAFTGGGVHIGYDGDGSGGWNTLITNCVIRGNRAMLGGGIRVWAGSVNVWSLRVEDSEISFNEVNGIDPTVPAGGGIWFQGNNLTVRNCTIHGNKVGTNTVAGSMSRGGGISIATPNDWTLIENCEITANVITNAKSQWGGGIFLDGYSNTVRNCLIADNRIVIAGGGSFQRGGGLYVYTTDATNLIESCTFAGNEAWAWNAVPGGSAVSLNGNGSDIIRNCIVYSNGPLEGTWVGGPEWYFGDAARAANVFYTCWTGTTGNAGCITNDPQFISVAGENYRLRNTSPCLNVASNVAWMSTALDLDNNARVDPTINQPDMGAYEYVYQGTAILIR